MIAWLMRGAATILFIVLALKGFHGDAIGQAFYGALALWVGSTIIPDNVGPAAPAYRRRTTVVE